uniref:Uncharacterized protein n=1 Tax=Meloidogyne javanica TaxID=6303 RepID=A0A915N0V5_MELJA
MGFFKRNINENNKKRKLPATGNTRKGKFLQQKGKNEGKFEDEEIPSDDDGEERSIDLNQSTDENLNEIEQTEENDTQYEDSQTLTYQEAKKLVESIEVPSASQDLDDFEGITEPLESQQKRKEELKSVQAHQKISDAIIIDEKNSFSYRPHKLSPICVWNMDEMGLMNRLYGHQDVIEQLDILQWPRVLSCGGMDKSCRLFKVIEESHLVFNGFTDCISIDCVALINEEHFISGSADGSLYIWSMSRKKPVFVKRKAHGFHSMPQIQNSSNNEIDVDLMKDLNTRKANKSVGEPRWICSVAALPYTDLVASGSSDGFLRLWRVGQDWKSLDQIAQFNMPGFINDIRFSYNGCYIVCAVGQEHKRGRWWTLKEAKNRIMVIYLQKDFEMREMGGGDGGESIELDKPNVGREEENEMRE